MPWKGEIHRSREGRPCSIAPALMRTGIMLELAWVKGCRYIFRPIQRIGIGTFCPVRATSPIRRFSIFTRPRIVRIRVPARKLGKDQSPPSAEAAVFGAPNLDHTKPG